MQILFVIRHRRYMRLFESTLRLLAQRGHRIHLAFEGADPHKTTDEAHRLVEALCEEHPEITWGVAPGRQDPFNALAFALRRAIDYLRYLSPTYADAPKLRLRGERNAPAVVVRLATLPGVRTPAGIRALDRVLRALERALPRSAAIDAYLRERRPDIMLVTPLIAEPTQTDYLRSAEALRIPSALCVASWDNLTNKGLILDVPDRVYVWNEDQVKEATELHGIPADRVIATGAPVFDQWFSWKPSMRAREFRKRVGLPAKGRLLLYLCSSNFIAPNEPRFVKRWIEAVRASSDKRLAGAAILVRPHPKSGPKWAGDNGVDRLPGVAVWPPHGEFTGDQESKEAYFDSMHHAFAVVGLNTSALIESTIVGRPAFTILDPEYAGTQEGTIHFRYLQASNGGPLTAADDFAEHLGQLSAVLDDPPKEVAPGFLRSFVRPLGLERDATPILADAIERQPAEVPAQGGAVEPSAAGAAALRPLAALASWESANREEIRRARRRARLARKGARRAVRRLPRRVVSAAVAVRDGAANGDVNVKGNVEGARQGAEGPGPVAGSNGSDPSVSSRFPR
jgi:hypothetical protein